MEKEVCERCRPLFEKLRKIIYEQAREIARLREELEEIKSKLKEKT